MEDSAIIDLYWRRSDQAISKTEKKYGKYCRSIAYHICASREDAKECVNDTWFRAWNLMPDKRPSALSVFLGGITRHFALDRMKAKNRKKRGGGEAILALDELSECIPDGTDLEQSIEEKELEHAIGSFVARLPADEKTTFILRYWYFVPVSEIAARMQFSQSKTKSMLFRVRNKLKNYLMEADLCQIR